MTSAASGPGNGSRLGGLRPSLLRQLLMPLVGTWIAAAFIATSAAYWFVGRTTDASFDRLLADDAHALSAKLRWLNGQAHFEASSETADLLVFDSFSPSRYAVVTESGHSLVGTLALAPPHVAPPRGQPIFFDHEAQAGLMLRIVALRVQPSAQDEAVWVLVAESLAKRQQVLKEIALGIFLPAALIGFVIIPLVYYGIRFGLAPARRISALVVQTGENDLSPLAEEDVPQELRDLVRHTNSLLRRLKLSMDEQRRFIADAAHQLQTPMAGIRLLVGDMRRMQSADPTQPVDREVLAQLDDVATRAARMVRQLLAFARADDEAAVEDQVFDAMSVVAQAVERWAAAAAKSGKTLAFAGPASSSRAPAGCLVRGSPTLLGEVISNLIDNALRYGGSEVEIRLLRPPQELHIRVCDNGPALDESTRARMLLPFWRGNHGQPEGSGLGLSIARRVLTRMGGTLSVGLGPGGSGTCLHIRLPVARPENPTARVVKPM